MAYRTLKYMKKDLPEGFTRVDKKTIQSRMTPILQELMEVADKAGVKLYLFFGNLLGYERHNKSFIPWDDDIDVIVSYWDRDKLARAIEKHKNFPNNILKTKETREWPGMSFSRGDYDVITSWYYEKNELSRYSIDIFEYANFEKKNDHKKIKRVLNLLFMKNSAGGGLQKLVRFLIYPLPKKWLINKLHKRERKFIKKDGQFEWVIIDDIKTSWSSTFNNSKKTGKFEGVKVWLPDDSNIFLNAVYGDWKKKPDVNKVDWNSHFFGERKIA